MPKNSDLQFALVMALKCPKIALVLQNKISPRMAYYMSWQANGSSFMPKNRKMRRNRHSLYYFTDKKVGVYLGVRTCEVFLCFVTVMIVLSIVLTSLFSLFYVTREGNSCFLHRVVPMVPIDKSFSHGLSVNGMQIPMVN